jgi:hypothetical protein
MSLERREFITFLRGAAAWPLAARAQGQSLPVVGFLGGRAAEPWLASFREGLRETGYIENQNVTVEYHWLDGQYDRVDVDGRLRPPSRDRDRDAHQRARFKGGQSCDRDDPDRLRHR